MNKRNYILLLCCLLFVACEDRREGYKERTEPNLWIESVMRKYYYWYDEIRESSSLNYYATPDNFFPTLLSSKDGKSNYKYSTIEKIDNAATTRSINEQYSYGFEYALYTSPTNSSVYYARILYVLPNTPAQEAGLKRGDWILRVNNIPINSQNYTALNGGASAQFAIGEIQKITDEEGSTSNVFVEAGIITIQEARAVVDNPVLYSNIYTVNGKNVAYLVYTHFTSGTDSDATIYDKQLAALSNEFKANNVSEFILDLRYNPGGNIPPAQLICTMLIPEEIIAKEMCYVEYNDQNTELSYTEYLTRESLQGGSNLNLNNVIVLTSSYTASASELVINALKPYMPVTLIGSKTEGKNVGSVRFTDSENKYPWAISPIVCKIYNANNESDYSAGFSPDYTLDETQDYDYFLPFGDTNEYLLNHALQYLAGTYPPAEEEEDTRVISGVTQVYSSVSKNNLPGVILNNFQ
ncbi:peptidase S41 [Bacteroides sp. 214]|uniref:S41 family peptidase n=1 Tax=Bacteroides sp. 214 TaxID=2302935 RepID=UPI0013D57322|nr:S41 family peptidase [Bacteroides sp. 214]NDW12723.1 peptidase S41 [Bacteroides sp. 214]